MMLNAAAQSAAARPMRLRTRLFGAPRASMLMCRVHDRERSVAVLGLERGCVRLQAPGATALTVAKAASGASGGIFCGSCVSEENSITGRSDEIEMLLRQRLDARGLRHARPFGAEHGERILLAARSPYCVSRRSA